MIVSDHGMTSGGANSGAEYVEIDDYLDMDDVSHVIDRGALAAVAPLPGKTDKVPITTFVLSYIVDCATCLLGKVVVRFELFISLEKRFTSS